MSHKGCQGRMSQCSGPAVSGAVILGEPEGPRASVEEAEDQAQNQGPLRCAVWPRQQTWLCAVPLLIGCIGLGLSLMLLKWIIVGTVRDYVPTDLVDANRIGQDPIFLSKPSGIPKYPETTTTTTTTPTVEGSNTRTVTESRSRTQGTSTTYPKGGRSQVTQRNPGNRRGPAGFTTSTTSMRTTFGIGLVTSSISLNPTVLHDSTPMWTREPTTTETTTHSTRSHGHRKTSSPTAPSLHSEHFKPCHEKDLAYCLNGGECFVIETLSGPHKHCKCREGHQGIRCDQFLPKTDTVLSSPNHLGIEFMESQGVYKRQVLSITSITMAISLLGTLCVALYCRTKRRREKLHAQLKESRSLINYTTSCGDSKARYHGNMQTHQFCRRDAHCHASEAGKCFNVAAALRGGVQVHSCLSENKTNSVLQMQTLVSMGTAGQWSNQMQEESDPVQRVQGMPPPIHSCSVPIIPSVHCHHVNEACCMQTATTKPTAVMSSVERRHKVETAPVTPSTFVPAGGQEEAVLLLQQAQEQLRALAHWGQEVGSAPPLVAARETVCFLKTASYHGPTQTLLLCKSHRDIGLCSQ
ncbi:pro-neuregulin-3, membrane-bound isoform [Synchiropus splendidus]|uniref:pro-neuregulin-3, membrane-bound isoform n=1 Tax=Synchiropus splendidus TaxID=270530 RepID=UPI00237E8C1B|nr:pro-neuregulin-3, membrane-bound isoform [Synchiropus splendidus]